MHVDRAQPHRTESNPASLIAWLALALVAGGLGGADPSRAQSDLASSQTVSHEQWAAALRTLVDPGRDPGRVEAPPEAHFAGLCAPERDHATRRDRVVRIDRPRWQTRDGRARLQIDVPQSGFYSLRVHGAGNGRWHANQDAVASLDPTALGVDVAPRHVALERGRNELAVDLVPGGAVERIELVPFDEACIAPEDGWTAGAPLRFGEKARTLAQTLGLEGRLPTVGDPIVVEGEHYLDVDGSAARAAELPGATLSQDGWARVDGERATFEYRLRAPEDGLYSLLVRMQGSARQVFWIDDHWAAAVTPSGDPSGLAWAEVLTLPLRRGEHTIRARAPQGSGIDVLHLVRRRDRDQDYVDLLESFGVQEGPVASPVRVADVERNLEAVSVGKFQLDPLSAELSLVESEVEALYKRPLSPILPGVP